MNYCIETEKLKAAMKHFCEGTPCPENVVKTVIHWKKSYWNLAPHSEFDCELLVNDFIKSNAVNFLDVMFLDCFIENLEHEDHKASFLNDTEKHEITYIKQFIVKSNLLLDLPK